MEFQTVNAAGLNIGGAKFTVIAGPCVAESMQLCMDVANNLSVFCHELGIQFIFKASFDKANRSSIESFRGNGMKAGLEILSAIRKDLNIPVITDVHETYQVETVAACVDFLQIPAFLCRQTDLLLACAESGLPVNVKKGQFLAPEDMNGVIQKLRSRNCNRIMVTERGSSFGYHNLVVDMRSFPIMKKLGVPVVFDATHSVQLPGGLGKSSGGQREYVLPLARAAAAAGIDALFIEVHPNPDYALSDGPNSLNYDMAKLVIKQTAELYGIFKNSNATAN